MLDWIATVFESFLEILGFTRKPTFEKVGASIIVLHCPCGCSEGVEFNTHGGTCLKTTSIQKVKRKK